MRRPIDAHAKVLVIGGHRYAGPPMQPGALVPVAYKFPTAFAQPGAALELPNGGPYEVDVAVGFVIGRGGERMSSSEARDAIAGVRLLGDVTHADDYKEEARTNNGLVAKNYPGLSPAGPLMALANGAIPRLDLWLKVNGTERQALSLSDLLWTPEQAIAAWSLATLVPGDIVALGAAAARRHIAPVTISEGDEIEIGSPQLGTIRHRVAALAPVALT